MNSKPTTIISLPSSAVPDCWKQEGVWGSKRCPELARVVHCRHCPTFAAAAARIFDQPWRPEWGAESEDATPAWDLEPPTEDASVLVFRLGGEWFGLPPRGLVEVATRRPVHSLPHRRHGVVLGLVNVRGELLVCVSLHRLLEVSGSETGAVGRAGLIVLEGSGGRVAAPVDAVRGVHRFDPATVRAAPLTAGAAAASCLRGLLPRDEGTVGLLDEDRLLQTIKRHLG